MPPDDLAAAKASEASDVALAAATTAGIEVRELDTPTDLAAVAATFDAVWGAPGQTGAVLSPEALDAIVRAGGQVSGAFRDTDLVAATAAFPGRDGDGRPFLQSLATGVVGDVSGSGVGTALKWHQRAWCLARGVTEVRWIADPLDRRTTGFHLVRLGAQVTAYLEDVHGRRDAGPDAGLPTDRLAVRWPLTSPRVRAAASGRAAAPDVAALRRSGAEVALDELADGSPHVVFVDTPRRLVRVPEDVHRLRVTDPDLALAWAVAVRTALGGAIAQGARVTGATRDGWIVVALGGGVAELGDRPR